MTTSSYISVKITYLFFVISLFCPINIIIFTFLKLFWIIQTCTSEVRIGKFGCSVQDLCFRTQFLCVFTQRIIFFGQVKVADEYVKKILGHNISYANEVGFCRETLGTRKNWWLVGSVRPTYRLRMYSDSFPSLSLNLTVY